MIPKSKWIFVTAVASCVVATAVGCNSRAPGKPELSPKESAEQALKQYDSDGDGAISEEEAEAAPGLLAAFEKIDKDRDGLLTGSEIEARIVYYQTATSWVINGTCKVTYKGKPLGDATVTFEPEEFLGASFQPCSGVTDSSGHVFISRPNSEIKGIFLGFYRVRISKLKENGDEMIPAKYNTETTLGFEANNDVPPEDAYGDIQFKLR